MSTVTAIADAVASENITNKQLLELIYDELAAIRASLGCATEGAGAGILVGSTTWDAGSILDGDEEVKEITVTGAALGDFVLASMSVDVADLAIVAAVTATNTVTAQLLNNTGGAVDLASATCRVLVIPKSAVALPAMTLTKE